MEIWGPGSHTAPLEAVKNKAHGCGTGAHNPDRAPQGTTIFSICNMNLQELAQGLRLERLLGRGATAEVFKSKVQGNAVAIKILLPASAQGDVRADVIEKLFREEAATMARLQCPQLIECLGLISLPASTPGITAGHQEQALCMVLEYMEAGSLARAVVTQMSQGKATYSEYDALMILRDVALAIQHLHSQMPPILHRDLKMENVLLTRQGGHLRAKLADLGLHRVLDRSNVACLLRRKLGPSQACANGGPPVVFYAQPESHMYITMGSSGGALSRANSHARITPSNSLARTAGVAFAHSNSAPRRSLSQAGTAPQQPNSPAPGNTTTTQPPADGTGKLPSISLGMGQDSTQQQETTTTTGSPAAVQVVEFNPPTSPAKATRCVGLNRGPQPQTAPLVDLRNDWPEVQPVLSLSSRTSPPTNPKSSCSPQAPSMYGSANDATSQYDLPADLPAFLSTPQSTAGNDLSDTPARQGTGASQQPSIADLGQQVLDGSDEVQTNAEILGSLLGHGSASVKESLSTALSSVPMTPSGYASPGPRVQPSGASGTDQGTEAPSSFLAARMMYNNTTGVQQMPVSNPLFSVEALSTKSQELVCPDAESLYHVANALRGDDGEAADQVPSVERSPSPASWERSSLTAALKRLRSTTADSSTTSALALNASSHHTNRQSRRQSRRLSRASWSFDEAAGPSTSAMLAAEAADVVGAMPFAFNRWMKPRTALGEPLFLDEQEEGEWAPQCPVTHSVPSDLHLLDQRFGSSGGGAQAAWGATEVQLLHGGKRPLNSFMPPAAPIQTPGVSKLKSRVSLGMKKLFGSSSPDAHPAALAASLLWSSHGGRVLKPLTPSTHPSTPSTRLSLASRPSEQPGTAERQTANLLLLASSGKSLDMTGSGQVLKTQNISADGPSVESIATVRSAREVSSAGAVMQAEEAQATAAQGGTMLPGVVAPQPVSAPGVVAPQPVSAPGVVAPQPVSAPVGGKTDAVGPAHPPQPLGSISLLGSSTPSVSSGRSWLQLPHPPGAQGPDTSMSSGDAPKTAPLSSSTQPTSSNTDSYAHPISIPLSGAQRHAPSRLGKVTLPGSVVAVAEHEDVADSSKPAPLVMDGNPALESIPSLPLQPSPFSAPWEPPVSEQATPAPPPDAAKPEAQASQISFGLPATTSVAPTPTVMQPKAVPNAWKSPSKQPAAAKPAPPVRAVTTTAASKPEPLNPQLHKSSWFYQLSVKGMSNPKPSLREVMSRSARGTSTFSVHGALLNMSRGFKLGGLLSQHNADSTRNMSKQGGVKGQMSHLVEAARQALSPEFQWVYQLTSETGSCMYMSPEVFKHEPYNEASDIYSFGIMMYEVLTRTMLVFTHVGQGRVADTSDEYARCASEGYRPERANCLTDEQWQLIQACWAQDPLERPNIKQVLASLEEMLQHCPPSTVSAGCSCCTIS